MQLQRGIKCINTTIRSRLYQDKQISSARRPRYIRSYSTKWCCLSTDSPADYSYIRPYAPDAVGEVNGLKNLLLTAWKQILAFQWGQERGRVIVDTLSLLLFLPTVCVGSSPSWTSSRVSYLKYPSNSWFGCRSSHRTEVCLLCHVFWPLPIFRAFVPARYCKSTLQRRELFHSSLYCYLSWCHCVLALCFMLSVSADNSVTFWPLFLLPLITCWLVSAIYSTVILCNGCLILLCLLCLHPCSAPSVEVLSYRGRFSLQSRD